MLWVVLDQALGALEGRPERAIHFAPEALLRPLLEPRFGTYETSSFDGGHTDHNADLRQLPFPNASYDFLIASHVLEHIKEDRQALSEIRRVLRPGGIAVLPVPLSAKVTVEYDAPNPKSPAMFGRRDWTITTVTQPSSVVWTSRPPTTFPAITICCPTL